jgi:hypothetical protein
MWLFFNGIFIFSILKNYKTFQPLVVGQKGAIGCLCLIFLYLCEFMVYLLDTRSPRFQMPFFFLFFLLEVFLPDAGTIDSNCDKKSKVEKKNFFVFVYNQLLIQRNRLLSLRAF